MAQGRYLYAKPRRRVEGQEPSHRGGLKQNVVALAWDGTRALFTAGRHIRRDTISRSGAGNIEILGIFVDAEGRRFPDPARDGRVAPDEMRASGDGDAKPVNGIKEVSFGIATGANCKANPAAAAGPEGSFLVAWREEPPEQESRIVARVVSVK